MTKEKVVRQRCTIYSRIVGYMSPLSQWGPGKKSEWQDRKTFNINKSMKRYETQDTKG